jgi:hypothetical protein
MISTCLEKSKEDILFKHANDILGRFTADLMANLPFVMHDVASLMRLITLLMGSRNTQIAENARQYFKKMITIFSQMLGNKLEEPSKKYAEDPAQIEHLSQVAKKYFQPEQLIAVVVLPVVSTLYSVKFKSKKEIEAGIDQGTSVFKGFSNDMKREAWQLVFSNVLTPFVRDMIELHNETQKKGTTPTSAESKDDFYLKLMKNTLKEFYFFISEIKDNDILLDYVKFLHDRMSTGDKALIDTYGETVKDIMQHKPCSPLNEAMLDMICNTIRDNIPRKLFDNSLTALIERDNLRGNTTGPYSLEGVQLDVDSSKIVGNCQVLLEAILLSLQIVKDLQHTVEEGQLEKLIMRLDEAHRMVSMFNQDILLRYLLSKSGYNGKSKQLPSLYKIEKCSLDTIICYLGKKIEKGGGLKTSHEVESFTKYLTYARI